LTFEMGVVGTVPAIEEEHRTFTGARVGELETRNVTPSSVPPSRSSDIACAGRPFSVSWTWRTNRETISRSPKTLSRQARIDARRCSDDDDLRALMRSASGTGRLSEANAIEDAAQTASTATPHVRLEKPARIIAIEIPLRGGALPTSRIGTGPGLE
jgi:hypothetical protein